MTPEQRSELARLAVGKRWHKEVPLATHLGALTIGDCVIECAVLDNGTRLLSRSGFLRAIGRTGKAKGGRRYDNEFMTPVFLTAENLKPFISLELMENSKPIHFRPPGGKIAIGYRAELLPQVCSVFLDAQDAGVIANMQAHIAQQCKVLIRGLAEVGITALVDEATGYQDIRARDALSKILEAFIAKELGQWVRVFPPDYYRELYRLKGLEFPPANNKMPRYFGMYTNDVVYSRLAPGVLEELKAKNPPDERGYRRHKHTQWLTEDVGHAKLLQHLHAVVAIMRLAADYEEFKKLLDRSLPKQVAAPLFDAAIAEHPAIVSAAGTP